MKLWSEIDQIGCRVINQTMCRPTGGDPGSPGLFGRGKLSDYGHSEYEPGNPPNPAQPGAPGKHGATGSTGQGGTFDVRKVD